MTTLHFRPLLLVAALTAAVAHATAGQITDVHDPSGIVRAPWVTAQRYNFILASTGPKIPLRCSNDAVTWVFCGTVFASEPAWWRAKIPKLDDDGAVWAPDVLTLRDGSLVVYYSVSAFTTQNSCIGAAKAIKGRGPAVWQDMGPVLCSQTPSAYNAIDPHTYWDADGKLWMAYGSFWTGIALVQLDAYNPSRAISNPVTIANRGRFGGAIEAAWVQRIGHYYYLFVNWDKCCAGVSSTYKIMYGRSTRPNGPFVDRSGKDMAAGGGSLWQQTSGNVIGPGHVGIIDAGGSLGLTNHFYDRAHNGVPTLQVHSIVIDRSGWPVVGSATTCLARRPARSSGWGTCSSTVAAGKSCRVKCSGRLTAIAGSCADGWWTRRPTCSVNPSTGLPDADNETSFSEDYDYDYEYDYESANAESDSTRMAATAVLVVVAASLL
eukprot:m51a1_g3657 putative endo-arabinosidase (435) ;mRNA; r:217478-218844